MSSAVKSHRTESLYDQDLVAWSEVTASAIRAGRFDQVDRFALAGEIEDMGKSERRALASHLRNLLMHLLKWRHQPARRSSSWRLTIINARRSIEDILDESPSLRPILSERIRREYPKARQDAAAETELPIIRFPETCPFTPGQLADNTYFSDTII